MYSNQKQKQYFELSKALLQKETDQSHLADLRKVLVYHEWKYAVENNPVISDYEYDQLYKKLEVIEAVNPSLITPSSPTQRVASDLTEDFKTVEHLVPMLCEEDEVEYVVEPKFDGGSIALVYENNELVRGATRGNGTRGDEITANARVMKSVPLKSALR